TASLDRIRTGGPVEALKNVGEVLRRDAHALVFELDLGGTVHTAETDFDPGLWRRVLDRVLEEDEKEISQKRFVSRRCDLWLEILFDAYAFSARKGYSDLACLLQNLVDVKRVVCDSQLTRIRHRQRKQAFHDSTQVPQLVMNHFQSLLVLLWISAL